MSMRKHLSATTGPQRLFYTGVAGVAVAAIPWPFDAMTRGLAGWCAGAAVYLVLAWWLADALFGFVALRLGGWARLGALALAAGSLLAITGMDRLELTTRDNPTIFLPLSLTGIALNGVGWIVLGLWLVSRRERP